MPPVRTTATADGNSGSDSIPYTGRRLLDDVKEGTVLSGARMKQLGYIKDRKIRHPRDPGGKFIFKSPPQARCTQCRDRGRDIDCWVRPLKVAKGGRGFFESNACRGCNYRCSIATRLLRGNLLLCFPDDRSTMLEVERYTKEVIESHTFKDGQVHTRSYYSRPGDKKDSQKENQPEEENKQQEENERQDEEANDKDEDMQDPQQPGGTEDEMDLDNDSRLITGLDATASDESDDEDDFGSVTSGRSGMALALDGPLGDHIRRIEQVLADTNPSLSQGDLHGPTYRTDFKSRVEKIIDLQKASEIKRRGAPPDLERVIQSLAGTLVRRKSCLNELFDLSNETISQLRTCLEQDVKVFAESDHTHTLEALRKTETANQDLLEQLAAMSADVDYFRSRLEEAEKANGALQAENNRLKES